MTKACVYRRVLWEMAKLQVAKGSIPFTKPEGILREAESFLAAEYAFKYAMKDGSV
jgi:hypothetical protein